MFYPRKRGWSLQYFQGLTHHFVLPAQAGMIPILGTLSLSPPSSTRASGDDPWGKILKTDCQWFYPRKRGWSLWSSLLRSRRLVLPAQAGMIPAIKVNSGGVESSTRASGDDPKGLSANKVVWRFYPRKRGWSHPYHLLKESSQVLPAQAGMIPAHLVAVLLLLRFTRVSGDDPKNIRNPSREIAFYPSKRGWSLLYILW